MKIKLHYLFLLIFCIIPSQRVLCQVYYDNWPKTRATNDRAF